MTRNLLLLILILGVLYFVQGHSEPKPTAFPDDASKLSTERRGDSARARGEAEASRDDASGRRAGSSTDRILAKAFQNRSSDLQVEGSGVVIKVLRDDNEGSRHQRFILELSTGQTILVAHNIDLAPRIPSLREGDTVDFYGEYEWNARGGVIHWTHHDPRGRHEDGWLRHNGQIYE